MPHPSLLVHVLSHILSVCIDPAGVKQVGVKISCLRPVLNSSICDWLLFFHLDFLQFIDLARLKENNPRAVLASSQWTTFQLLVLLFHLLPSASNTRSLEEGKKTKKNLKIKIKPLSSDTSAH